MFDKKSRYANLEPYEITDPRGRRVKIVPVPFAPVQTIQGIHLRRQGQRLDHLAQKYLKDPCGFWRICEMNDVMLPESLSEANEIDIPTRGC